MNKHAMVIMLMKIGTFRRQETITEFSQMTAMAKSTLAMKRTRRVNLQLTLTHPTVRVSHIVMT